MNIEIYNPRNTQAVELYFRGEKMAKVMGSLAAVKPSEDHKLSGVLVKRGFNYHLIDPSDLSSRWPVRLFMNFLYACKPCLLIGQYNPLKFTKSMYM